MQFDIGLNLLFDFVFLHVVVVGPFFFCILSYGKRNIRNCRLTLRLHACLDVYKRQEHAWGTGGPGYQIKAEFNDKSHVRGVISMARSNDPNSAGSQFFICHGDPKFLDRQYTAFGKLIKGDDVLEKIGTAPTQPGDRPVKRMGVTSVKIVPRDSVK